VGDRTTCGCSAPKLTVEYSVRRRQHSRKSTFLPGGYVVRCVVKDVSSQRASHGRFHRRKQTSFQENDMAKSPGSTEYGVRSSEGQGAKKPVLGIQTAAVRQRWTPLKPHLTQPAPHMLGLRLATPLGLVSSRTLIPVALFWMLRNTVLLAPRTKDLMVLQARRRALDTYSPDRTTLH
jgi:hypothetical protein